MSANHAEPKMRRSKTTAARVLRHVPALLLMAATAAVAQSGIQTGTQTRPTAPDNPYQQFNQNNQVPAAPANSIQTTGASSIMGLQTLGGGLGNGAPSTNLIYPDPTQYVLNPGDLISVRLYASPDYNTIVRIAKDGTVELPLIGSVNLGGINIRQGETLIATTLKTAGMYTNPDVIIGLAESSSPQTVSFAGEKAGVFLVQGQRSLLDVIAGSGGLPINASRTIYVIRPGQDAPIIVNLGNTPHELVKANIPIYPRDTIFVERAGSIYILGAFKQQGAYPMPPTGLTLLQAAALGNGPLYAGKYSDLRLVRTVGTERTEVKVDINRIQFGLDPDPILQPGDVIFLPTTPLKRALAAGGLSTLLSAVSVLLIAIYQRY